MSAVRPASFFVPAPASPFWSRRRETLVTLLFLGIALLFLFLDERIAPVALRDEARNANNAIDMWLTGPSLIVTYDLKPDLWNTKPPLMIWLMSGSMALFGPSEWALRLPSAIAALGMLVLTLWFVRKVSGSFPLALTSAALLLFSPGFFGEHGARTADFDATLSFFVTAGLMLLFLAFLRRRPSLLLLLAAGGLIGLGALTKSIAAFVPVVGALLFIPLAGRFRRVLAGWWRYALCALVSLLPLVLFYALREATAPGYLSAVLYNDVTGRFTEALVEKRPPGFYLDHLVRGWFFAGPLLLGVPLAWLALRGRQKLLALYAASIVVGGLAVYTAAENRAMQYALPLFPWLSMLGALTLRHLANAFVVEPWLKGRKTAAILVGIALLAVLGQLADRAAWWRYHGFPDRQYYAQSSYGDLFSAMQKRGVAKLFVVDPGVVHYEVPGYAPMLRWNRLVWNERGLRTTHLLSDPGPQASPVASCEPAVTVGWRGPLIERVGECAVRWPGNGDR
jgi:4-amino-4-deoxy-L-arabinose transferase-like glycosyltransferase